MSKKATQAEELDHGSHRGMRYGVLDLMRCTEQTAVLMAGAEGRGIKGDMLSRCASLSMAGFISRSMYHPRFSVIDEIYDRKGTSGKPSSDSAKLWAAVESKNEGAKKDKSLSLDFCLAPVDGKHALTDGYTGGTISSLCFAPTRDDPESGVFAQPRIQREESKSSGQPSIPYRSPPWLLLSGSQEFLQRFGGRDALFDFVKETARRCVGKPVENLVYELFADYSPDSSGTSAFPIQINQALAVLNEPSYMGGWNRRLVPAGKKRLFVGSSVALSLASMFPRKGFDCSIGVTRHSHAVQVSVAARVLGGVVVAIPLCGAKLCDVQMHRVTHTGEQKANKSQLTLVVESDDIWLHDRFVTSNDAALIVSGISEHVVVEPVRFRDHRAEVHTLCLSARTKSVRTLTHRITLDGPSATRFVSFDAAALDHLEVHGVLPQAEWDLASVWRAKFEDMFNELQD